MLHNKEALLRQYELMVNSTTQVTNWRQTTNGFYLTVNTTLLAIVAFVYGSAPLITSITMSVMGISISILWHQSIDYYRKTNGAKFKVINEIEKYLPIKMFKLERDNFEQKRSRKATQIEQYIPIIFAVAYAVFGLVRLYPILQTFLFSILHLLY